MKPSSHKKRKMRLSPEQLARRSFLRGLVLALPASRVEQLLALREVEPIQVQRDRVLHPPSALAQNQAQKRARGAAISARTRRTSRKG